MAFENVFEVDEWRGKPSSLTMRGNLQTVEQRTEAMASVLKVLYTRGVFGGWRDEVGFGLFVITWDQDDEKALIWQIILVVTVVSSVISVWSSPKAFDRKGRHQPLRHQGP